MGGGYSGPSDSQIRMQQQHEAAMMQLQMEMMNQQMAQQESLLKYQMDQAERQRLAGEEAARQAAIQSQSTVAQQAAQANQQQLAQSLMGAEAIQGLQDQNILQGYQEALTAGGEQMTGGYDMQKARESALANLGAASSTLPATYANLVANPALVNPAATTAGERKAANLFNTPSTVGLTFGGS